MEEYTIKSIDKEAIMECEYVQVAIYEAQRLAEQWHQATTLKDNRNKVIGNFKPFSFIPQ